MKNFITLEGSEGVGKSTQVRFLKEYCEKNNIDAVFTREPGGSKIAEEIRKIILDPDNKEMGDVCEAFLYAAARNQHLKDIVEPALKQGKIVFCDRYIDSSYAYQGFGRGLGFDFIKKLNALAIGEFLPQYTIFLDLSPQEAFLRKGGADKADRLEQAGSEFFDKVYQGYKTVAEQEKERFIIIKPTGTKFETHDKIVEALKQKGIFPDNNAESN